MDDYNKARELIEQAFPGASDKSSDVVFYEWLEKPECQELYDLLLTTIDGYQIRHVVPVLTRLLSAITVDPFFEKDDILERTTAVAQRLRQEMAASPSPTMDLVIMGILSWVNFSLILMTEDEPSPFEE